MRRAEAVLGIVRGSLGEVTGELIDTETVRRETRHQIPCAIGRRSEEGVWDIPLT
jgi:hypothetical protein